MLSSSSISSGAGAAAYYENLAREDYYTIGGEPPGKWVGEYAREIGLTGEVQKGELAAGFAGFHPRTGEVIANNAGPDHKSGYDLTFSAPKSVSVVWATSDRETQKAISEAHQRAVEKALAYASDNAFRQREGHAGAVKVEHTSGMAFATFEHGTSREGEAQLHTHALTFNLAENGKTVDFDTGWKMATGAAYRAEMSQEMQQLGFPTERDGTSFRLVGVPDSLEQKLSTRSQQIRASMREHGTSGGKAANAAALDTRRDKGEINRGALFEQTREIAKEYGFSPEDIRSHGLISGEIRAVEPDKFDSAAFLNSSTDQASTLTRQQLEKELFQAAQGSLTIAQAKAKLEDLKASGELVELKNNQGGPNRWTTKDMLTVEQRIADTAARMATEKTHPVSPASLESAIAKKSLSDDQKTALAHITSPERIAVVQGIAGAGKSYMLDAARDAWERDGYVVRGAALSGKAAEGLQESSGIQSGTIHSLVGQLDREQLKFDQKTVLVIDEAGMVGSRLFDKLQQHADAAGAKIVLVGDTKQLQPIDAGGVMRAVHERAGAIKMDEIRRQADRPEQQQIVRDFRDGKADEAIDRLEKLDAVKIYATATDARAGMAAAIVSDMQAGKTSIGLAGTRAEVHQINQQARAEAKTAGLVSETDHKFQAERGARQFADGDRVIFLKNDGELGVKNGTTGTVERAAEGNLQVRLDNGKTVEIGDQKYAHVDHGYAMTVHKSQGVTVDAVHNTPGRMTDQHAAYVGCSRHRETVQLHGTAEQIAEMRTTASRDHTKDTSADQRYTPVERQHAEPAQARQEQAPPTEKQIEALQQKLEAWDKNAAELREKSAAALEKNEPKTDQVKPEAVQPDQAKPEAVQPDQVKPEPDEAKPEQPQPQTKEEAWDKRAAELREAVKDPAKAAEGRAQAKTEAWDKKAGELREAAKNAKPNEKNTAGKDGKNDPKLEAWDKKAGELREKSAKALEKGEAKPSQKQAEQQRQLKSETAKHQQPKPERQVEQKQAEPKQQDREQDRQHDR